MCWNCKPLIKAIDAFIQKADEDLADELAEQGYIEPEKTVEYIKGIEEEVAEALLAETDYILAEAEKAIDLEAFVADIWPGIKLNDILKRSLMSVFTKHLKKFIPEFIEYHLAQTDWELKLTQVSKRTTAWVEEWSRELSEIMQLNSHKEIEHILERGLKDGKGIAEFARDIQDSGIRNEYYKARRVAVTEVLTAHRAAQQESFMQSPSVNEKMWRHTGIYRNEPRQNHVEMDGERVPKGERFTLKGIKGGTHNPMYPGDTDLPPEERINCHCINQPVVSAEILGLTLEERQKLQQEAVAAMDEDWEKEQEAKSQTKDNLA